MSTPFDADTITGSPQPKTHTGQRTSVDVESPRVSVSIDTTGSSPLHAVARYRSGRALVIIGVCVITIGITYVPMVIAALLGAGSTVTPTTVVHLPFFRDWSIAFRFLVSLPLLVAITITDQKTLDAALTRIQLEGILFVPEATTRFLTEKWQRRFRTTNRFSYSAGVALGAVVVLAQYVAYTSPNIGYWVAPYGVVQPAGYFYFFAIFLFYLILPVYLFRNVMITLFLSDLVGQSELSMLPFHPDNCGGLRPVGRLGLRNQYVLTVFGLNFVLVVAISLLHLKVPASLLGLWMAAAISYLVLGPVVFIGPLLPFRAGMIRAKLELGGEVAQRLRIELHRVRQLLPAGILSAADEELIDRLRKIAAVVDELPIWPFNAGTLRKFLLAYAGPVLSAVSYPVIRNLFALFAKWLRSP